MSFGVSATKRAGKRSGDHIDCRSPGGSECLHCGDSYQMTMPCPIDVWVAASQAYLKGHRRCRKPKTTVPRPDPGESEKR